METSILRYRNVIVMNLGFILIALQNPTGGANMRRILPMKTYQYDYYVIDIPEDVYPMPLPSDGISDGGESYTDDELIIIESEIKENRANLAIDIARENAK